MSATARKHEPTPDPPRDDGVTWVSANEAARLAGTHRYGVLRLTTDGRVRARRFAGRTWFSAEDAAACKGEVRKAREARRRKLTARRGIIDE